MWDVGFQCRTSPSVCSHINIVPEKLRNSDNRPHTAHLINNVVHVDGNVLDENLGGSKR